MAKKHRKKEAAAEGKRPQQAVPQEEPFPKKTKKIIAAGVGLLAVGFYLLTWTDPNGRNWASHLSPFLILGAYGVIALGLMLPDSSPEPPPSPQSGSRFSSPPSQLP